MELRVLLVWVHRMSQRNFGERVSTGSKLCSMLGGGGNGAFSKCQTGQKHVPKKLLHEKNLELRQKVVSCRQFKIH